MNTVADGWAPCSDRSRARDDPLAGTASRGDAWLLVEVSTGWGRHAFLDPPFDRDLGRALMHRVEGVGMRALAIRRPGRRPQRRSARWAVVESRPGREGVRWGEVDHLSDMLEVPLDGSTGSPSDIPIFAVCAHGRHDQCCAVRGRQVAQRLAERYPDETWECSHLGGDRFAGTMVLLPHGLYYGRVDDGDALDIADAYAAGTVVDHYLRGRSSLSHAAQAAQHFARAALGDHRIGAYAPLREERRNGGWTVELAVSGGAVTITLADALSPALLSTCAATRPLAVPQFALIDLTTG